MLSISNQYHPTGRVRYVDDLANKVIGRTGDELETETELDNLTEFNTAQNRWALVSSTAVDTDPSFLTTDSEN